MGEQWIQGIILKPTGPVSYEVQVGNRVIHRNVDQLRSCAQLYIDTSTNSESEIADDGAQLSPSTEDNSSTPTAINDGIVRPTSSTSPISIGDASSSTSSTPPSRNIDDDMLPPPSPTGVNGKDPATSTPETRHQDRFMFESPLLT